MLKRTSLGLTVSMGVILLSACMAPADVSDSGEAVGGEPFVVETLWEVSDGIDTPESVYVDADSGFIFVSQIAGEPDGRDGNGRIVQLSADGEVLSQSWVAGLNAPKGLRSRDGVLWTADLDEIIGIDIATAGIVARVTVDGAQFLNDVAIGDDGTVYVSDMAASGIYALRDGEVELFRQGEDLEWPNGLFVEGGRLIVGGWGQPEADFTTLVPGRLYALDLATGTKSLITPEPFANIDGVEGDGSGGYIITDYLAGKLMHVSSNGAVTDIAQFEPGTADLAFIAAENVAIVPHMNENRVVAYDLSGFMGR